jgi:hypothetical protein
VDEVVSAEAVEGCVVVVPLLLLFALALLVAAALSCRFTNSDFTAGVWLGDSTKRKWYAEPAVTPLSTPALGTVCSPGPSTLATLLSG